MATEAVQKKAANRDKIKEIEDEIAKTQYNKATQHHIGLLKAKISRLREKEAARSASKGGGTGFAIKKSGDATIVLLGFPSVGKSTLLNGLTGAKSAVAAYAFTTLTCIPGQMKYKHANIQILDVPGIVEGAASGRGRGREVLQMLRSSDMILILIDALHPEQYPAILQEIDETGIRINQRAPDVKVIKKAYGGISIGTTLPLTKITKNTIEAILKEFRVNNADVVIRTDISAEQMIDVLEGSKKYLPAITVINKIDLVDSATLARLQHEIKPDLMISADKKVHLGELKEVIYRKLDLMPVFLKEVNKKADMDVPLIVIRRSTIGDICSRLHRDFLTKFKFAKIWGKSAKFPGQVFRKHEHILEPEDVLEVHLR